MRRSRTLILAALLVAVVDPVANAAPVRDVPLPRPRPFIDGEARPATPGREAWPRSAARPGPAPPTLPDFPAVDSTPTACEVRLSAIASFTPLPVLIGPGGCGASEVVSLEAITMPDKSKIPISPPATLRCSMAEALTHFIRDDVGPLAQTLGSKLAGLAGHGSYECRGRNRVVGAKVSEHGRGNAVDIQGLKLASNRVVELTDPDVSKEFRERLRVAACGRFMTVLGPGSDGYHENHIHLDLAERSRGYRMCQWDVRDPLPPGAIPVADVPLPLPRPTAMIEGELRR